MGFLEDLNTITQPKAQPTYPTPTGAPIPSPYQAPTLSGQPLAVPKTNNYLNDLNNIVRTVQSKLQVPKYTPPAPTPIPYQAPTQTGAPIPKPTPPLSSILNPNDPRYNNLKDLVQGPSLGLGKFIVQPAYNMASSAVELATGKPASTPKLIIPPLFNTPGSSNFVNGSSYQNQYVDAITKGTDPKDAYKQVFLGGLMDAIQLAEPIKSGVGSTLKTFTPSALIDSSINTVSKDALNDYFSGRKTAGEVGITPEMRANITQKMSGMSTQEKAQFLQGFDLLNAKPSFVGKMFGVTDAQAKAMLDAYGGEVRSTPSGALPGYKMNYQAGGANIKGEPVGFGSESIPPEGQNTPPISKLPVSSTETPAEALARSEAYAKAQHPSVPTTLYRAGNSGNYFSTSKEYPQQGGFSGKTREVTVPSNLNILDVTKDFNVFNKLATPEELKTISRATDSQSNIIRQNILKRNGYDGMKFGDEGSTTGKNYETVFLNNDKSPDFKQPTSQPTPDQLQSKIDLTKELIAEHPRTKLNKLIPDKILKSNYLDKQTGENLPIRVVKANAKKEVLNRKLQSVFEGTPQSDSFDNYDVIEKAKEDVVALKERLKALQEQKKNLPKVSLKSDIRTGKPIRLTPTEQAMVGTGKRAVPFMPKTVASPATLPELPQTIPDAVPRAPIENYSSPQDTTNKVDYQITGDTPKERIQSAITNSERAKNEIISTGQDAYSAGTKVNPTELIKIRDAYQAGTPIKEIASSSSNPKAVENYLTKLKNYYDLELASDRASGGKTDKFSDYLPHYWDLSDPKKLDQFNQLAVQRGLQPYDGFRAQPKVFASYAEGEHYGFKPKNENINADLKQHTGAASTVISKQVLKQGLKQAVPSMITTKGYGRTATGKPYINSNVPGLEGLAYDPLVHNQLKGYQPKTGGEFFKALDEIKNNPTVQELDKKGNWGPKQATQYWDAYKQSGAVDTAGSVYDKLNKEGKTLVYTLSGFHNINIGLNYGGKMLLTNPLEGAAGIGRAMRAMVSEGYTQKLIEQAKNEIVPGTKKSVFQAGLEMGVNTGRELDPTGKAKYNPLTVSSHMVFDRFIYTLRLSTIKVAATTLAKKGIAFNSPQGRQLGIEINQLMGDLNNHIQNINPNTMKWFGRFIGTPRFTGSKFGMIKDAATQFGPKGNRLLGSPAGNFARQAVFGKQILVTLLATLGGLIATGKFPSLKQVLFTPDPTSPTNLTNPKGQKLDITFPRTYAGEATAAFTDPRKYLMDRLAPALKIPMEINTPWWKGQDQFGNPTVDVNKKESVLSQEAKVITTGLLPIGVQAVTNAVRGKITPTQAGIAIGGLRTAISKNDPTVLKYKGIDDAKKAIGNITPDDPNRTQKMQDIYNTLTPEQKKSLNYQLLLDGTNTKGVLSSDAGKLKPLYDKLQVMKANGQTAEANAEWAKLSPDDKKLYAKIKTYYKKSNTTQEEKDFEPTFTSIRAMKTSSDPALQSQADTQYNALTAKEKHIYQLLKKQNL